MFGFGLFEFLIIIVLLLTIIKTEDLPKVIHQVSKFYGQCQRIYFSIIDELNSISNLTKNNKK